MRLVGRIICLTARLPRPENSATFRGGNLNDEGTCVLALEKHLRISVAALCLISTPSSLALDSFPPAQQGADAPLHAASGTTQAAPQSDVTVTPAAGVRGKKYDLTLRTRDCKPDLGEQDTTGASAAGAAPTAQAAKAPTAEKPAEAKSAPASPATKWTVKTPEGGGVHESAPSGFGSCYLIVPVTIDDDAGIGPVPLQVVRTDKTMRNLLVNFDVMAVAPGAVPLGLNPPYQVDVMWGVLPRRLARDNFGHWIAERYYAVEVIIGNDSGYPLQIAGTGFCLWNECPEDGNLPNQVSIAPTASYRVTRGTLSKGQQVGTRANFMHIIQALGPVGTGITGFFHNTGHKATFTSAVDLFSNPIEKGIELVWPDTTIQELARLDDQMLRDGLVIPNNTQIRTLVFFPKESLAAYLPDPKKPLPPGNEVTNNAPDSAAKDAEQKGKAATQRQAGSKNGKAFSIGGEQTCAWRKETTRPWAYTPGKCANKADLNDVMHALGRLVLIGETIQYLNRVRVESNPPGPESVPPTSLKLTYKTGAAPAPSSFTDKDSDVEISIAGKNLKSAALSVPDTETAITISKQNVVSDTQIDATITVKKGTPKGSHPILVKNGGGTDTVAFEITEAAPAAPPATTDNTKSNDPKKKATAKGQTAGTTASPSAPN
jgi:hypothetical protein